MTADPLDVVEALRFARAIVTGRYNKGLSIPTGWTQRTAHEVIGDRDCYCVSAAITLTSPTAEIRVAAIRALTQAMPGQRWTVSGYNDYCRDVSQVSDWIGRAMVYATTAVAA